MGYYDFPHTRNYDSDLGFLIKKYKELSNQYDVLEEKYNTLLDIYSVVQKNIRDITIEQLQKWLDDGTLEGLIANFTHMSFIYTTTVNMLVDTNLQHGYVITTLGYSSPNDNGGAVFEITNTQPNSFYFPMAQPNLYAKLLPTKDLDVMAFGATENSLLSDVFNTAIKFTADNNLKLLLSHNYLWNPTVRGVIPSNAHIIGDDTHTITVQSPYNLTNYEIFYVNRANNVTIDSVNINGNKEGNQSTSGEWGHCIAIYNSTNVIIKNCYLSHAFGDGIEIGLRQNDTPYILPSVTVDNCTFDDNRRQGISVLGCECFSATNSKFINTGGKVPGTGGTAPGAGIDFEPSFPEEVIKNAVVDNCYFANNTIALTVNLADNVTPPSNYSYAVSNFNFNNITMETRNYGLIIDNIYGASKSNIYISNVFAYNMYNAAIGVQSVDKNCCNITIDNVNIVDCTSTIDSGTTVWSAPIRIQHNKGRTSFDNLYKMGNISLTNLNFYYSLHSPPSYFIAFFTSTGGEGTTTTNDAFFQNITLKTNTNKIYGSIMCYDSNFSLPSISMDYGQPSIPSQINYEPIVVNSYSGSETMNVTINNYGPKLTNTHGNLVYQYRFIGSPQRINITPAAPNSLSPICSKIGANGMYLTTNTRGSSITFTWNGTGWTILNLQGDWIAK